MSGVVQQSAGLLQRNLKLTLRFNQATLPREHHTEIIVAGRHMIAGTGMAFLKQVAAAT